MAMKHYAVDTHYPGRPFTVRIERLLTLSWSILADSEHLKKQPVTQFIDWDKNRQKVKLVYQNKVSSALSNAPNNNYKYR
jgi:hypothetical protein